MPLNIFYTMVQKSQKMTKNSNQGGSCLKLYKNIVPCGRDCVEAIIKRRIISATSNGGVGWRDIRLVLSVQVILSVWTILFNKQKACTFGRSRASCMGIKGKCVLTGKYALLNFDVQRCLHSRIR